MTTCYDSSQWERRLRTRLRTRSYGSMPRIDAVLFFITEIALQYFLHIVSGHKPALLLRNGRLSANASNKVHSSYIIPAAHFWRLLLRRT